MISVRVRAIGPIRRILGARELDISLEAGMTAESLLRHLNQRYGDVLAPWVTDGEGRITGQYVRILVNGRDLFVLDGLGTILRDGDVVSIIPMITGGV